MNSAMKAILVCVAIAASFCTSMPAAATGIPTFDAAMMSQLQQQFRQLQQQYETLKQQYAAVTGSYGRGQLGLSESSTRLRRSPARGKRSLRSSRAGPLARGKAFTRSSSIRCRRTCSPIRRRRMRRPTR